MPNNKGLRGSKRVTEGVSSTIKVSEFLQREGRSKRAEEVRESRERRSERERESVGFNYNGERIIR